MLPHEKRWHIAKKLTPSLRESRLLWFANGKDGNSDGSDAENAPENEPGSKEHIPTPRSEVQNLGERIRSKFADTKINVIARATISSPVILRTATDILEIQIRNEGLDDENIKTLVSESNEYLRKIELGEEVPTNEKEELEARVESMLENTALATAVAEAYERREGLYEISKSQLKGVPLHVVTRLQVEMQDKANVKRKSLETNEQEDYIGELSDEDVKYVLSEMEIDPVQELNASRDNLSPEELVQAEGDANVPTERFKRNMIEKIFRAARTLAIMEKTDFGSEETLHGTEKLDENLQKQRLHAQRHLERTIGLQAVKMHEGLQAFRTKVAQEIGGTPSTEDVALHLGIPEDALKYRMLEIEETLQQALGISEENDALRQEQTDAGYESADEKQNILPNAGEENFVQEARLLTDKMNDLNWLNGISSADDIESAKKEFAGRIDNEKKAAEAWTADRAPKLKRFATQIQNPKMRAMIGEAILSPNPTDEQLDTVLNVEAISGIAEIAERVKNGTPQEGDLDFLLDELSTEERQKIDQLLLLVESPILLEHARSDARALANDTTENTAANCEDASDRLSAVEQKFFNPVHPCFEHEVSESLEVPSMVQELLGSIQSNIQIAESNLETETQSVRDRATQSLRIARRSLERIEAAGTQLDDIMDTNVCVEERSEDTGTDEVARYQDGKVILFRGSLKRKAQELDIDEADLREKSILHEQGHGIVDICMRRTGALPKLFVKTRAELEATDEDGRTLLERIRDESDGWEMTAQYQAVLEHEKQVLIDAGFEPGDELDALAKERADLSMQDFLTDEFINKHASWKSSNNDSGYTDGDLGLFVSYDSSKESESGNTSIEAGAEAVLSNTERGDADAAAAMAAQAGGDTTDRAGAEGADADPMNGQTMTGQKIVEAQGDFFMIKEFIQNNSQVKGMTTSFAPWVREWEQQFELKIKQPFYREDGSQPMDEQEIQRLLKILDEDFFSVAKKKMETVTSDLINNVGRETEGKGLVNYLMSIELVSIMDMVNAAKSAGEDISRMWKRRGERVQSNFGRRLTDWIPDNNLWFGLNYAGQLKHEFGRRSEQSELDEVKQWKDSLVNVDAFRLQELLGRARNRDQVRALVELLAEQGRLDWNDPKFWNVLSNLSGMRIPAGACKNDSELRDKWLQTTITAIWNQKDRYFDWRKQNDDGISSGKGKFSQLSDQLSNIDNGLKGRLQRQLTLWVDAKERGVSVPEDVNPHLYEEVLHYAMRMGKMSMEQKLFYLVQGVRYGLISVDRLQALAGEHGGVLPRFPVIDYFNQRNNTIPELEVLGQRIENPSNRFTPGTNTQLWLQMEVLRDKNARSRILKATSGLNAENLDHEDIPTIMAQADVNTVMRMSRNISGSREKLSPEGAKNAYTGFGTKFKVLARVAEAGKFGDAEVMEAAKSIAAYTFYDNISTRNGQFDKDFSALSWSEFDETSPSSAGLSVSEYRNSNNAFVSDLVDALGNEIDWAKVGSTQENIIRRPGDTEFRETGSTISTKNYDSRLTFAAEIAKTLKKKSNQEILKRVLKKHGNDFREEGYGDAVDVETVHKYFRDREQHGVSTRRGGPAS